MRLFTALIGSTAVLGVSASFAAMSMTVVSWGKAIEVPGTAALNGGGRAVVNSVSRSSVGKCAAGGDYLDSYTQAFVADDKNGVWGSAIEVPDGALNTFGMAQVNSISCASAGNCSAGGSYWDGPALLRHRGLLRRRGGVSWGVGGFHAVAMREKKGVWHKLTEVPGSAALNAGGSASVLSVSCVRSGRCALGGKYADAQNALQAFVTSP